MTDTGVAARQCPHCDEEHPATALKCPHTDLVLPLEGRVLDKKFCLIRQIGKGGMAQVWLAINTLVDRMVAIKLIRPEVVRREETVARFRSEARAAGRIGHPNICDILDFGSSPIGPFIVMEYLRGRSLGQFIRDEGTLPCGQAVAIVRQALAGLVAAHREGIIHRDLKPENLFIHEPDAGEPIVKLMDFGVSKFTDGSNEVQTADGALLGTPEYMSPEQFRGAAHADERTDVWAMGAILYRALTGDNAFGGPTIAATLLMVSMERPRPITDVRDDVPPELVAIVERCLEKDPALRFASARELSDALAPFATDAIPVAPARAVPVAVSTDETETRSRTTRNFDPPSRDSAKTDRRAVGVIAAVIAVGGLASWYALQHMDARRDPSVAAAPGDDEARVDPDRDRDADANATGEATPVESGVAGADEAIDPSTTAQPLDADDATAIDRGDPPTTNAAAASRHRSPSTKKPDDHPAADHPIDEPPPVPPKDPAGTIRFGVWLTLQKPGPNGPHRAATKYCDGLAEARHLGIGSWKLASPTIATKLVGAKKIKRARYWTSALWHGKAVAIKLPAGDKSSLSADNKSPHPLCVAKWP